MFLCGMLEIVWVAAAAGTRVFLRDLDKGPPYTENKETQEITLGGYFSKHLTRDRIRLSQEWLCLTRRKAIG